MKHLLFLFFMLATVTNLKAQNALVEIESINKGLLLPRLELLSTLKPDPLTQHIAGMVAYNIEKVGAADTAVSPGLYYNNGKRWLKLVPNPHVFGDLKFSYAKLDHDGWYALNGRVLSTLPTVAQANASNLGFKGFLPDAAYRYFKGYPGIGTIGKYGGDSTVVLDQANLPDVQFSGQTFSGGAHQHLIPDATWVQYDAVSGTSSISDLEFLEGFNLPTNYAGEHTHDVQVNSGGSSQPVLIDPPHILVNVFIYLGK
jgi:hypothetical protein